MPMYNLIEYCSKYFDTTCSLWFYSKNKATNFDVHIANTNNFKFFNISLTYWEMQYLS